MATQAYMQGRKQYGRPQAMLWADNPGTYQNGFYLPNGSEIGSEDYALGNTAESFIICQMIIVLQLTLSQNV